MAGNDVLIYDVVLKADDQSKQALINELNELNKTVDRSKFQAQQKAAQQTAKSVGEVSKATQSYNVEVDKQIKSVAGLQQQLNEKRAQLRDLNKETRQSTGNTEENAAAQLQLQTEIKGLSSDLRNVQKEFIANENAIDGSANTYNELVNQNKALMIAMKEVPLDDTSGRLEELQGQYKENNDKLKEFDSSIGNHQRNVGNYESALGNIKQGFVAIQGPLGGVASRVSAVGGIFQRFTLFVKGSTVSLHAFRAALIATGIGAFIVALGGAIKLLTTLQPVMDAITRGKEAFGTAVGFAATKLGAFLGINEDVNTSLSETIKANDELVKQQQLLRREEIDAIVPLAKRRKEINELREAIRDENITVEERLELLKELKTAHQEQTEAELYLAEKKFRIMKEQVSLTESTDEELRELAETEAEIQRIQERAAQQRRTFMRDELRLVNELEREEKERQTAISEASQAELEARQRATLALEKMREEIDATFDANEALDEGIQATLDTIGDDLEIEPTMPLGSMAMVQDQLATLNQDILMATSDQERRKLAIEKAALQERLGMMEEAAKTEDEILEESLKSQQQMRERAVGFAITLIRGAFGQSKAAAVAEAVANTYTAATNALRRTPFPPPAPQIAAAATVAFGMRQVKKIMKTKIGSGGSGSDSDSGGGSPRTSGFSGSRGAGMGADFTSERIITPEIKIEVENKLDEEGLALRVKDGNNRLASRNFVSVSNR